jgi:hypothetical protein
MYTNISIKEAICMMEKLLNLNYENQIDLNKWIIKLNETMLNRTFVLFNGQYCRQNEDLHVGFQTSAILAETLVFRT